SVVTLSSHLHNPVSDGEAFDIDSSVAVDRLLPGGDLNHKITDWLDTVATYRRNVQLISMLEGNVQDHQDGYQRFRR
ncbi:MAG: hypothetical protein ACFNXE_02165, partial [Rothia dentocariosa]